MTLRTWLLEHGLRRPRTFAEYMATPAKRAQRDAILAMGEEHERRAKWTDEQWKQFFADLKSTPEQG